MATLLTVADLREHIETDLGNDALGRYNDDVDSDVILRYGPVLTESKFFEISPTSYPEGRDERLDLHRKADSITTVTEQVGNNTPVVLNADDYELLSGTQIKRLDTGTNPRNLWGHDVTVAYVPVDTTAKRKGVIIAIVKMDVVYNGFTEEKSGDYWANTEAYTADREAAFKRLEPSPTIALRTFTYDHARRAKARRTDDRERLGP